MDCPKSFASPHPASPPPPPLVPVSDDSESTLGSYSDFESEAGARKLHWGDLCIQTYRSIPGDHPDCDAGPPITMDWEPMEEFIVSIDEFESKRQPRRSSQDLRMNWIERRKMLGKCGFESKEITKAWIESKKARMMREETIKNMKFERWDIARQSLWRKAGRLFHRQQTPATKY